MKYAIEHESRLSFVEPVREHQCEVRLAPRENEHQRVASLHLSTEPESAVSLYQDCFGNTVHFFDVTPPHRQLVTRLRSEVETLLTNPFAFSPVPPPHEQRWLEHEVAQQPRLLDFVLHRSPHTPAIDRAAGFFADAPAYEGKDWLLESVVAARDWLADHIEYEAEAAEKRLPLQQVIERGSGDARDLAHALVALVRAWNVPARYVAGYHDVSDEEDDPSPVHAWAEVLIPGAGWRGFDVVNRLVVNDFYVAVAAGRDADDTRPLKTVFKGEDPVDAPTVLLHFSRQEQ